MLRAPLGLLLLAVPLFAQTLPSVTPTHGSTLGGDEVIIKGVGASTLPSVLFDGVAAPFVERVDADTLRAITPPHPPGTVRVAINDKYFTWWMGHEFTYFGEVPAAWERVLLPVFGPPISGANGSEFRTELRLAAQEGNLTVLGIRRRCVGVACPESPFVNSMTVGDEVSQQEIDYDYAPGFLFVPREQSDDLVAQLRVFDVSREATNFGTEIPVVRERDFFAASESLILLGVPTDPRFRNTLRIYGTGPTIGVQIELTGNSDYREVREIVGRGDMSKLRPATASIFDLPVGVGDLRITITPHAGTPPGEKYWAFVTVTNNETQHVTVISPQR